MRELEIFLEKNLIQSQLNIYIFLQLSVLDSIKTSLKYCLVITADDFIE